MKKLYTLVIFCFSFIAIGLFSCEIYNPKEDIPAYIHIDSFFVATDYSTQGSASQKITDAWLYVDDELIGAFELPVSIPVLKNGLHNIIVRPGIKLNGIAATRSYYPFYKAFVINNANLEAGKTLNISPTTTYEPFSVFKWKEDFESAGVSMERTSNSDTTLVISNDINLAFKPPQSEVSNYSGVIFLDMNRNVFEFRTINSYNLPIGGTPVFLELNYKTNNYFEVGVLGNTIGQQIYTTVMYLSPNSAWNKIYINLTPTVSSMTTALDYRIFIRGVLDAGSTQGVIQLDNIKLITQ